MRLRLLDRYVLSELLYPFIFGIASFSSIFIASSMLFKLTQYMTKYGASGETIARLFMYSLPEVVNYTFPMSMLLASLMAFGKLSGSSEIVAMKSGYQLLPYCCTCTDRSFFCQHVFCCLGREGSAGGKSTVWQDFRI
jgi:hypothetical protein